MRTSRGGRNILPTVKYHMRVEASPLLRPAEVAARLGVSRTWVYEAAKSGRLPCVRIGGPEGPLRFVAEDITRWLDEARSSWRPGRD